MNAYEQFEIFTFHGMEEPFGFIHLKGEPGQITSHTKICMTGEGLTVDVAETVNFSQSISAWESYNYVDGKAGEPLAADNHDKAPSVPAYALGHYALELARNGGDGAFIHIHEATGDRTLAEFKKLHTDEVVDGDGILHSKATHYVLEVGGQASNQYWVSNGIIVRSDWPAATSLYTRHPHKALETLPESVVAALRELI